MKIIVNKNIIKVNNKECDLEKFDETKFFLILEEIVKNENDVEFVEEQPTPLALRFLEILKSEIQDKK